MIGLVMAVMKPISSPDQSQIRIDQAYQLAERQLKALIHKHPGLFPMYTRAGRWVMQGETWTNWCEGFLAGMLWLIYERNGQAWWREQAERYTLLIEPRKTDRSVHDLGFLFWSSWKRWYDLTGDPALQQVVIEAGRTLAQRYQSKGGYLPSFLAAESTFIDIMMNVGIIFYAGRETGDGALWEAARQHCLTTRRYLVRGDGSTAHEGIFDLESGEFLRQSTQQGYRGDSCWARGLAWALYGFATVYGYTGEPGFLETSRACADFYIEHTSPTGVPPNDFDEPDPKYPSESSAAAIAASGLLELAGWLVGESRRKYHDYALQILATLTSAQFLADETPNWEGILLHGIYHQGKGLGVDESVMWGDYFFLEALSKVNPGA
jgi:unsaturated chondroitin disaccharide hydrolase